MNKMNRLALAFGLGIFVIAKTSFAASPFPADVKMPMNFKNIEVTDLIESFAKNSQKTFVVDPGVRGKISVFTAGPVDLEEAFDLISTSLAQNGYAIVPREGRYVVMAARNAQRSSIETLTEITNVKPERYVTMIFTLKNMSVREANMNLRILPSKDGDMTPVESKNQLIVTDFISNVNRIGQILKQLDQPVSANVAKLVKESKEREMREAKNSHGGKMKTGKGKPAPGGEGPMGEGP